MAVCDHATDGRSDENESRWANCDVFLSEANECPKVGRIVISTCYATCPSDRPCGGRFSPHRAAPRDPSPRIATYRRISKLHIPLVRLYV